MAFFFGHFSINVGKDFKREKEKDMKEVCTNFNGNYCCIDIRFEMF